jgi:NitT/TauT family transport system permease protein
MQTKDTQQGGNDSKRYAVAGALAVAAAAFFLPVVMERLPSRATYLPIYALFSFNRMLLAYLASLVFAVLYGYYAATKDYGEKYLVPLLDILQSIPILGFFPAVLVLFVSMLPGGAGTELAASFLIFTSMAWNMAYAVYESAKAIPDELRRAAEVFGMRGPNYFALVIVPASVPKLVYNSMVSWSNAWFFLVASEIISLGSESHELPGLGSFLVKSAAAGDIGASALGVAVLAIIVAAMNTLVWKPLANWSKKFKYDTSPAREATVWDRLSRVVPFKLDVGKRVSAGAGFILDFLSYRKHASMPNRWDRLKRYIYKVRPLALFGFFLAAAYFAYHLFGAFALSSGRPMPVSLGEVAKGLCLSFARLLAAYAICAAWTLPLGLYMARNERAERLLMPLFEVTMAIPGIAFLPAIIVAVLSFSGPNEIIAMGLLLLGMQGYLLFNTVAGAKALPSELDDAARVFGLGGPQYYLKVLLPATLPSFVTGSLAAWGGGWNALVVAEYVNFGNSIISVDGIGSLLNKAIYVYGDVRVLIIAVVAMVIPILLMNKFLWKELYRRAVRFKAV